MEGTAAKLGREPTHCGDYDFEQGFRFHCFFSGIVAFASFIDILLLLLFLDF